jgi:hypothetical protein
MAQLVQMLNTRMIVSMINRLHPMKPNIPHITDVTHVTHLTRLTPPRLFPCLCPVFALSLPTPAGLSPERLRYEYLDNPADAASDPFSVLEGNLPAMKAEGVVDFRSQAGHAVFEVGSGTYQFSAPL